MDEEKKAEIILHQDYRPMLALLDREQVGALVMALMAYNAGELTTGDFDKMDQAVRVVFRVITDRADREAKAYEEIRNHRKQARQRQKEQDENDKPEQTITNADKPQQTVTNADKPEQTLTKRYNPNPNPIPIPKGKEKKRVKEKAPNGATPFVRPTLEEVEAYCRERGNSISAQGFINYYESQGWKVGKNPMKDWRAAVRLWESRDKKTVEPEHHAQKNSFNNFEQRKVDYDAILREQELEAARRFGDG